MGHHIWYILITWICCWYNFGSRSRRSKVKVSRM